MLLITSEVVAPMTMMVKMMVTRTLGLITSEVVAPGGKEGELWGSEGLGPGEILNAALNHQDDNDADDEDDDNNTDDDSSQGNQHWTIDSPEVPQSWYWPRSR